MVADHEKTCLSNPETMSCTTCLFKPDHEKTCLSNPETMSCTTCLFKPDHENNICGCGVDVKSGLEMECDKYICHDDYINKLDERAFEGHRDKTDDEIIESIESYDESKTNYF